VFGLACHGNAAEAEQHFVSRLPEALRADVGLGREFLRETLQHVRVTGGGERRRTCPICDRPLGKITPQHLALHGVGSRESYLRFPALGFTKGARLVVQPSPEGLLNTGKVFGLVVAGARNHLPANRSLEFRFAIRA